MIYRLALAHTRNFNAAAVRRLAAMGISPRDFFEKDSGELALALNADKSLFEHSRREKSLSEAAKEIDFIRQNKISVLFCDSPDYPSRLLECPDAPALLYCLGSQCWNSAHVISIVGTRHCTAYGKNVVEDMVRELADTVDNLVIVSGMAYGVDICAHRSALAAGVPTIAVVAHGLNTLYPADHRNEARSMLRAGGALMTEYRSSDSIHKGNFLARNRIVAGLADAVIIVESDLRGGAMVTARLAADYHREVLAVPGRVSDIYSRGCNKLIKTNAAQVYTGVDDILAACAWTAKPREGSQPELKLELTESQELLMTYIKDHPDATVNDMTAALGMPFSRLSSVLFELEMSDLVTALPGGRYAIR